MFPEITVSGSAYERGRQYGVQAKDRIRASLAAYAHVYRVEADLDWSASVREARRYLSAVDDFAPELVEEMSGIAAGAGIERDDVLAMNVRTEIMFSARVLTARSPLAAAAPSAAPSALSECTAIAAVTPSGRVVAGQNWDWAPFALDTCVVLRSDPDDGPRFVTVVEAGLLAKFGVNEAGLALMTNALACSEDVGAAGVPYHVLLRAMIGCDSTQAALDRLGGAERASSANYLLVDKGGHAVDVEGRPGDRTTLHHLHPDADGHLSHTNHFVAPDFAALDYTDMVESTSRTRFGRVNETTAGIGPDAGLEEFVPALTDHANAPDSVCRHVDASLDPDDQSVTAAAMLVDLTEPRVLVAEGPPCLTGFEEVRAP